MAGAVRVGVGGWTFEPWRGVFYPDGLPKARELDYASRRLTALEINGTYYRTQTPETFAKWAAATPDDFVFTVKALRFTTNRRVLSEAADSVARFLASGLSELGAKLGPILWQFAPTKRFERDDFASFLDLLPERQDGVRLRHALEVRHESFRDPAFVDLARERGAAVVYANGGDYPEIADLTADFVYARLQGSQADQANGYPPAALDRWSHVASQWSKGVAPDGLAYVDAKSLDEVGRDVFLFFISGAKETNPAAAMALIDRL